MPWWAWLPVSLGALTLLCAVAALALLAGGRRDAARALAGFLPDCAVLVARLARDRRVPRRRRALLVGLAAYLALPFDLIPDALPGLGQLDDALLVALVLRGLVRGGGEELVRAHWPGPESSLRLVLRVAGAPAARPRSA